MANTRAQTTQAMNLRTRLREAGVPSIITTNEAQHIANCYGVNLRLTHSDFDAVSLAAICVQIAHRGNAHQMCGTISS
jgi:hypothetical protein